MTLGELMAQILSEASGKPLQEISHLVEEMAKAFGARGNFNEVLSETEANELIIGLRKELPAIRAWLIEGRRLMIDDIKNSTKH